LYAYLQLGEFAGIFLRKHNMNLHVYSSLRFLAHLAEGHESLCHDAALAWTSCFGFQVNASLYKLKEINVLINEGVKRVLTE